MNPSVYNILDFGAKPGVHCPRENAAAIQKTVDACAQAGGGVVYIPKGSFVSGSIELRSNITLHLDKNAELIGSTDYQDYQFMKAETPWAALAGIPQLKRSKHLVAFIYAEYAENVKITGEGTIDGQGMEHKHFPNPEDDQLRMPFLIIFHKCKNLEVSSLTLNNPGFFTVFFVKSMDILVRDLNIDSYNTENGDGVDFDGCENAVVTGCTIKSGDDAISLKTSDPAYPCKNIRIDNCTFTTVWAGFRIGTETAADIRDITMKNCVFDGCSDGIKIQNCSLGTVADFHITDITMRDVQRPFFITRSRFRLCTKDGSIRPLAGEVTDLYISRVTAQIPALGTDYTREGMVISGTPTCPIGKVVLEEVAVVLEKDCTTDIFNETVPEFLDYSFIYPDIFSYEGNLPTHGFFVRHITELQMKKVALTHKGEDRRVPIWGYGIERFALENVSAVHNGEDLLEVLESNVSLSGCLNNGRVITQPRAAAQNTLACHAAHKATAVALDKTFEEMCILIDEAEAMKNRHYIDASQWHTERDFCEVTLELKPGAILLIPAYGDFTLSINNKPIRTFCTPQWYENLVLWAYRTTESTLGNSTIRLQWQDLTQRSGLNCRLPFGSFDKQIPSLAGNVSVCWE